MERVRAQGMGLAAHRALRQGRPCLLGLLDLLETTLMTVSEAVGAEYGPDTNQ
jgi:hypothetical protein